MIKKIKYQGKTLAIIIPSDHNKDGVEFLTPNDYPLQLAYMQHHKGHVIQAHRHIQYQRKITQTQEVLIIKKGKLKVDFYGSRLNIIKSIILKQGDLILLTSGAHGFEAIEDLQMIEIKQGPFCEGKDKVKF